ncbi:DUF481 domain-containing protein [Aquisalimonas lutea]|uniref:DUF481 domain-containing protein n=1 Tax=Aquisalimonas lutea TaxID=1327750 RepID=UPI0025B28227|nr:DUF481 domain-containing protein [Aquisalimonas lutea]MDN3519225.1 DUF481 domain-containing protein [Aquisalimonas lutea]
MRPRLPRALALLFALALPTAAPADTLLLDNGDRITGTFVEIDDDRLTFRPDTTDEALSVPLAAVAQLRTDDAIQVLMEDGTQVRGRSVASADGTIRLQSESFDEPLVFPVTAITRGTGPETPVRPAVRTSGDISLGMRLTGGNDQRRSINGKAAATVRTEVNRLRFNGEFNQAEDDGEETEDNAAGNIRYDHFVSERTYVNANVGLARDEFRDLRLRSSFGVGLGYQVFDTDRRQLSGELGISYVNEDYYSDGSESNPAGRWALDYEERLAGDGLRLFHTQEGLVNVDDTDDVVITTRTGLRFPIAAGITGTVQANVDYESQPVGDNERTSTAYVITAGYSW